MILYSRFRVLELYVPNGRGVWFSISNVLRRGASLVLGLPRVCLVLVRPYRRFLGVEGYFSSTGFALVRVYPSGFLASLQLFYRLEYYWVYFFFRDFHQFVTFDDREPCSRSRFLYGFGRGVRCFFGFPIFASSIVSFIHLLPSCVYVQPRYLVFIFGRFSPTWRFRILFILRGYVRRYGRTSLAT